MESDNFLVLLENYWNVVENQHSNSKRDIRNTSLNHFNEVRNEFSNIFLEIKKRAFNISNHKHSKIE